MGFLAVAHVRVLGGVVAWMGANPHGLLYSTASFLGGGVCGLRSVGPLSVNI